MVTLGLDASQFTAGQRAALEAQLKLRNASAQTAKDMQADGKKAAEFFSSVKAEALGLVAVLVGAGSIEAFAAKATKSMADVGRSAKNIGIAIPELEAFRNMIERNGGSADAATASMEGYAAAVERFRIHGDASIFQYLNPIGAGINDGPLAVFMKFMAYVQKHRNEANGAQLIGNIGAGLGYDKGLVNAALQMETLAKAQSELKRSYELGVPSAEQVKQVTEMQSALTGLSQAATNAGEALLSKTAPGITATANALADLIPKMNIGVPQEVKDLIDITKDIMDRIDRFYSSHPGIAKTLFEFDDAGDAAKRAGPDAFKKWQEQNDPVTNWWRQHAPEWLGGSPADISNPQQQSRLAAIRDRLAAELGISPEAASGIVSNLYAESGVRGINELNPTVPGSRGGFGWAQWTGARRDAFEAYSKNMGLDPSSDAANYSFLISELRSKYPDLLAKLRSGKITADQAANEFYAYESGGAAGLENKRGAHVRNAGLIAGLKSPDPSLRVGPRVPFPAAPSNTSNSVSVGSVVINTQATDAKGISQDFANELVGQANRGLN